MAILDWIAKQLATQWIAIITAIAGFIVWRNDHAKLIINTDTVSTAVAGILNNDGQSIVNKEHGMQHLNVWLINPSSVSISFYDLRLMLNDHQVQYITDLTYNRYNHLSNSRAESLIPFNSDGSCGEMIAIEIPESNHGTIPAHGFLQLDLVFEADAVSDDGMFVMKLALKHSLWSRFRHSRFASHFLRPKMGYAYSETQEIARAFRVVLVKGLNPSDPSANENGQPLQRN